jgi:spermidine synthase
VQHEVVARAESERGEVVVRRRRCDSRDGEPHDGPAVLELRVNGVFVMDTAETGTERRLARATLEQVRWPRRVLVGGLGLGYTVRELLDDARVQQVVVAELEPVVVEWMRAGVLPGADLLDDPRVEVVTGDVLRVVRDRPARSYDVVLLDVDNGPDFLVHEENAAVYTASFLRECRRLLRDRGALAVWSSTYAPALEAAVQEVFGGCHAEPVPVRLQRRDEHYWLFTGSTEGHPVVREAPPAHGVARTPGNVAP